MLHGLIMMQTLKETRNHQEKYIDIICKMRVLSSFKEKISQLNKFPTIQKAEGETLLPRLMEKLIYVGNCPLKSETCTSNNINKSRNIYFSPAYLNIETAQEKVHT